MSNIEKTGLVGISGNKVVDIAAKAKEPTERQYEIITNEGEAISAFGVLVVAPGFVGIGDKDQTEIKAVVPFQNFKYAQEAVMGKTQGTA